VFRLTFASVHVRDVHGNGIPVGMGIPKDSHGNANKKQISMEMGMWMISVGVGMLENVLWKKFPLISNLKLNKE